jgi:hypothetical protein
VAAEATVSVAASVRIFMGAVAKSERWPSQGLRRVGRRMPKRI